MNLQQLIGEVMTLALAYPGETEVEVQTVDFRMDIAAIMAESVNDSVQIMIKVGL